VQTVALAIVMGAGSFQTWQIPINTVILVSVKEVSAEFIDQTRQ
jgi:hypothetical protein